MIATQQDARRIIASLYDAMPFKLTTKTTIGVRPVYDVRPTLVWRKLDKGRDSAVRIGRMAFPSTDIDWSWAP